MINQPTAEEQLKSIDEKLQEKKEQMKVKKYGRGKYPRVKKTIAEIIPAKEIKAEIKPEIKSPTLHVILDGDMYTPNCFTSYKLFHTFSELYFTQKKLDILRQIGINIIVTTKE